MPTPAPCWPHHCRMLRDVQLGPHIPLTPKCSNHPKGQLGRKAGVLPGPDEQLWSAGCYFTLRSQRGPESQICSNLSSSSVSRQTAERLFFCSQRVGAPIYTTV